MESYSDNIEWYKNTATQLYMLLTKVKTATFFPMQININYKTDLTRMQYVIWTFKMAVSTRSGHVDCCISLMSTRKEARWSVRSFSLLTVDNEGYVQQTSKQNWTLNSNEQKALRSHSIYMQTEERSGKGNN